MTPGEGQLLALSVAFWVGLWGYRRAEPSGAGGTRFALGLLAGALAAHLGWAAMHAAYVLEDPRILLVPAGWSVLFVPVGILAVAPWRAARDERDRFLHAAGRSLPLALATARVGCLSAGCCHGVPTEQFWGVRLADDLVSRHPTAIYEIAGLVALHAIAATTPGRFAWPMVLGGFGLLRLVIQPWRAEAPIGEPLIDAQWIALMWMLAAMGFVVSDWQGAIRSGRLSQTCSVVNEVAVASAVGSVDAPASRPAGTWRRSRKPC